MVFAVGKYPAQVGLPSAKTLAEVLNSRPAGGVEWEGGADGSDQNKAAGSRAISTVTRPNGPKKKKKKKKKKTHPAFLGERGRRVNQLNSQNRQCPFANVRRGFTNMVKIGPTPPLGVAEDIGSPPQKPYPSPLPPLLVGDSDVGKQAIPLRARRWSRRNPVLPWRGEG
ncbi:hypothetical protein Zmor_023021 [Zophobas morio]|uniref:Uncharacterized protein n=1 Tax=Zophobas morio TaxID=2755281 RepID=A0AA38HWF9_9CUCU|nr:hypothetical protein Zmor_023021 [Zophobas morio]